MQTMAKCADMNPYQSPLEPGKTVELKLVDIKGELGFAAEFLRSDPMAPKNDFDCEKSIRLFSDRRYPYSGVAHRKQYKAGAVWICRIQRVQKVDFAKRTKDGRVYVKVDVEPLEPQATVTTELAKVDNRFLLVHTIRCGELCEKVEEEVGAVTKWYKTRESLGAHVTPAFLIERLTDRKAIGFAIKRDHEIGKERFVDIERKGLEKLVSPESVAARFDALGFPPVDIPEIRIDKYYGWKFFTEREEW